MTATSAHAVGRVEHAAMWIGLFTLTAGLPWEWTQQLTRGQVSGGSPLVALYFIALGGFLMLQMNGHWASVLKILEREPLLLLFLGWVCLSFLWSDDPITTIRRTIALLITSYLGVHLVMRFSQFEVLRLVSSVLAAVVGLNFIWIILFPQFSGPPGGTSVAGDFDDRLTGIFTSPNPLGRVMALAVFTMLAAYKLDRRRRPMYVVALLVAAGVLALSQSKTALIVSLTTSAMLVVYPVFRARKTLFGAVAVSMVTTGVGSVLLLLTNFGAVTRTLDRDVTLTGRIPLWQTLFPEVSNRPLVGNGYDAFWNGWGSPAQIIWNQNPWLPPHGHNEFLDVTLELGLIGLAIYVLLLYRTTLRSTRYIRDISGVFGLWPLTFMSFYFSATITESGVFGRDIVWALLVACITLVSLKKRSVDEAYLASKKPTPKALPQTTSG